VVGCAPNSKPPEESVSEPVRIALSTGGCFGPCPSFDVEVDSTGLIRYRGRELADPDGYHTASGERETFARLAETALAVGADSARTVERFVDDHEVALVVWFGEHKRSHLGTRAGFGDLAPLVDALLELPSSVDLSPTLGSHEFESFELLAPYDGPDVQIPESVLDTLLGTHSTRRANPPLQADEGRQRHRLV